MVRTKSKAYRLRSDGRVDVERIGTLHQGAPILEWGSVTKTVTASIADRLGREGVIDLSMPVTEYLPQSRLPLDADVRSLAEHTSGLPRLPRRMITSMGDARDPYAKYTTARFDSDILPDIGEQLRGPVGTFEYSNLGYAVLTRVLEVAADQDWWTLAKRYVFDPLGIADVSVRPDPQCVPPLRTWTGRLCKQWTFAGPFVGAGGLHGTFDALESWAASRAQGAAGRRPFGWMDDGDWYWHNGGTLDHGAFVAMSHDGLRVMTVHTLGHNPERADAIAARLQGD